MYISVQHFPVQKADLVFTSSFDLSLFANKPNLFACLRKPKIKV